MLRKALQNRVDYIRLSTGNPYQDHHVRELILAENILWISQTLIPEQKIVVWTHNTHVQKSYSQNPVSVAGQVLMGKGAGEIIHNVNPDQVYAIGLYAGSGSVWRFWDQQHLEIGPLDSTYLEHQLLDHGKDLFINLNQTDQGANDHWIFSPVNSLNYGYETVRLNLRDNYDGLLFIHQVSVAQWLDQLYNDGG
ncbi:MAG: erythromycin esterase family protein [Candidatus Cyclobacteriaceae bacterium M3_2C_046]